MNKNLPAGLFSIPILIFAIASFQIGASFATKLFPFVGPFAATALRQGFSALFLIIATRLWRIDWRGIKPVFVIFYGLALGLMNLSFYLAIARVPLGIVVAIEFSGPLFIGLISSRRPLDFLFILLVMTGLYFLLPLSKFSANIDPLGVFFAGLAAVGWGIYIYFGHHIGQSMKGLEGVALGMVVSCIFTVPVGLIMAQGPIFTPKILLWGAGLAIMSSALPYSLEMLALKRMSRQTFSLMMSLEPAFAAIAGAIILSQWLKVPQLLGVVLVVSAALGSSLTNKKSPPIEGGQ